METLTKVSEEEYLLLESQATFKSEYHAGEIVAMAGAQRNHNLVIANLMFLLGLCLRRKCRIFPSDMLLKLPECEKYVYPDVMIACGEEKLEIRKGIDVLLNPTIVIEVLSVTTAHYDRDEKLRCYLTLESLKECWLIDSEKAEIISYKRSLNNNDEWIMYINKNINEKIKIGECEIDIQELYLDTILK